MAENIEIERKFLVELPCTDCLDIRRKLDIVQIYLRDGISNGNTVQRRVREIMEDNRYKYFYTEKIFMSPVERLENEYEISFPEYNQLLQERKTDCVPIEKKRVCFEYRKQLFELDVYPFSDRLAVLELELENAEQEIFFPVYINVIKEVTGIKEYSNAMLANAGRFPDCKES